MFETAWDNVCWRVNISPVFTEKHGCNTTSSPQQTLEINNLYLDPRLFGVIVVILRKHLGRIIDQIFFFVQTNIFITINRICFYQSIVLLFRFVCLHHVEILQQPDLNHNNHDSCCNATPASKLRNIQWSLGLLSCFKQMGWNWQGS